MVLPSNKFVPDMLVKQDADEDGRAGPQSTVSKTAFNVLKCTD